MGWTLFACFGCTNKRKRHKTAAKYGYKSRRRICEYEPLHSEVHKELQVSEPLGSPREKSKDEKKTRIRKRVRFNLDVVTYEPLRSQDDEYDSDREETGGEHTEQAAAAAETYLSKVISNETTMPSYSSNYRYNNCYDGADEYDEDDDGECQISDDNENDEDDGEDSDAGCIIDPQNMYYEGITQERHNCCSTPLISSATNAYYEGTTQARHNCSSTPLISSATNARLRSRYIVPVLNPIENLSQWKTVKTRRR